MIRDSSWVRACFSYGLLALAVVLTASITTCILYGSIESALKVWQGIPIELEPRCSAVAIDRSLSYQTSRFHIVNHGHSKVRIVGSHSSCSCVGALGIPIVLEPGERREVDLIVVPANVNSERAIQIILLTDVVTQPRVAVRVALRPLTDSELNRRTDLH